MNKNKLDLTLASLLITQFLAWSANVQAVLPLPRTNPNLLLNSGWIAPNWDYVQGLDPAPPTSCFSQFNCTPNNGSGWVYSAAEGGWAAQNSSGSLPVLASSFPDLTGYVGGGYKFTSMVGGEIQSKMKWPVTPGKTYTFSVYLKSDVAGNAGQAVPQVIARFFDKCSSVSSDANYAAGCQISNNQQLADPHFGSTQILPATFGNQAVNQSIGGWQEVVLTFTPTVGQKYVSFTINQFGQVQNSSPAVPVSFWVANAYLGERVSFAEASATKTQFTGSSVSVDQDGNFKVHKATDAAGVKPPFFPICVYASWTRPGWGSAGPGGVPAGYNVANDSWQIYKNQGFNCNMESSYPEQVMRSKLNGLMTGYSITAYSIPLNNNYGLYNSTSAPPATLNPTPYNWNLADTIGGSVANGTTGTVNGYGSLKYTAVDSQNPNGLLDSVLFYYWDNEKFLEWDAPTQVAATINSVDCPTGSSCTSTSRMHPIFQNNGNPGLARKYGANGISDIIGTYVYPENSFFTQGLGFVQLKNQQAQTLPVTIGAFTDYAVNNNTPTNNNKKFIAAAYTAIANGAKGLAWWKDCYGTGCSFIEENKTINLLPVEQTAWWSDFPKLAATIQSQLAVIQQPVIQTSLTTNDVANATNNNFSWHLTKTSNDNVQAGTRTGLSYKGKSYAYIIAGNEGGDTDPVTTASFNVSGLSYTPTAVINAYTKDPVVGASASSTNVTLPIAANTGGFFMLGDIFPDSLALNLNFNTMDNNVALNAGVAGLKDESQANNSSGGLVGNASIAGLALSPNSGGVKIPAALPSTGFVPPSLEMNNDLTLIAKVNISASQTGKAAIITKGADGPLTAGYAFFFDAATNQLNFWYGKGGTSGDTRNYSASSVLPQLKGAWHTVAVSVQLSSGTKTFYIDGVSVGTVTGGAELPNTVVNITQPLQIGAWAGGNYLTGSMANVRIYKAALTAQQIALADDAMPQTITFGAQASRTYSAGGTFSISPLAAASSNLPISYSSNTQSVCKVTGTQVTIITAGTCTIAANQAGNANYRAAATVTQNITINKAIASVTLSNLTRVYTGSPLMPTVTTNPSGLAVTWTNAPQTNKGTYSVTATVNDVNFQGSRTRNFTIN